MTIEITREIEDQLKEAARVQGVSVGQYIERLIIETSLRQARISEFQTAIAERIASLDAGETEDGEYVMRKLAAEIPCLRSPGGRRMRRSV